MKLPNLRLVCLVVSISIGLLVAWNACLGQEDAALSIGRCTLGCGYDDCEDHNHNCDAKDDETCSSSEACCRGPDGNGTCTVVSGTQCTKTGCENRRNEMCNE
jgi:hypothetical protein